MKIYLKSMLYTFLFILICTVILTIFNYFNILNGSFLKIFELIVVVIGVLIGSFIIGHNSSKKGYIEGIKYGSIWAILFTLMALIMRVISLGNIIYFLVIIATSAFGGILGINKKTK